MRRRALPGRLLVLCLFPAATLHAQQTDVYSLQQQLAWTTDRLQMTGFLITSVLMFLMGAACLALWWNARGHKALGTLGLYLLAISAVFFVDYFGAHGWNNFLTVVASLLFIEVTADCLRISKLRWIIPVRLLCAAVMVTCWIPSLAWTFHVPIGLSKVLVLVLLVLRLGRPLPQDRLTLRAITPAVAIVWFFRLRLNSPYLPLDWLPWSFSTGGWRWYYGPLATVLFGATAITTFVRELIRDRHEKQRMAAELEAGRAVQQVLLGTETPAIPGLRIESVYKPAGEVGGDFFHIQPGDDGSVLIVVGDVSGKGLQAAMTVSAIVGALRDRIERQPAQVLAHLNRVLCGQISGFVTCAAALVAKDGSLTLANAGHISPYRNGEEMSLDSALPLGVSPETTYPESTVRLAAGDTLTFLSDGVVEARNATGELFGFDRTAAISTQTAEEIAQAAQSFGQEDDITVLSLTFAPARV